MNRRTFLRKATLGTILLTTSQFPLSALESRPDITKLTILHTNDVHSRIEPFPSDSGKYAGLGGAAKRATLIKNIRKEADHVLLLDAGDIFQGTPFFNFFGGELEFKLMSRMGYDACTLGNHDFDNGIEGLKKQYNAHANFPIVNCNYDFSNTIMKGIPKEYIIVNKGGLRIGITGLGIELDGLVPANLFQETQYKDPVANLNRVAKYLKQDMQCDYVICLSHLGYKYRNNPDKISDTKLAPLTRNVDLIIGGHTHTLLDKPDMIKDADGNMVTINQVGWAGIALGRLDIYFEKNRKNRCVTCGNTTIQ